MTDPVQQFASSIEPTYTAGSWAYRWKLPYGDARVDAQVVCNRIDGAPLAFLHFLAPAITAAIRAAHNEWEARHAA